MCLSTGFLGFFFDSFVNLQTFSDLLSFAFLNHRFLFLINLFTLEFIQGWWNLEDVSFEGTCFLIILSNHFFMKSQMSLTFLLSENVSIVVTLKSWTSLRSATSSTLFQSNISRFTGFFRGGRIEATILTISCSPSPACRWHLVIKWGN